MKSDFESLLVSSILLNALEKMNISVPTEIQRRVIPLALNGSDVIAIAQTGSGKTLAFALSLLTRLEKSKESRALILVPSREIALQINKVFVDLCLELPISMCVVIGGIPNAKQVSQLNKIPRLLIATPGRLNDQLRTNKLLLKGVDMIVIDEAERMLDMGFLPQLKNIQSTLRGTRQVMMFSASFNSEVESVAKLFTNGKFEIIRSEKAEKPVSTLNQKILFIENRKKKDRLLDELNATTGGVIVFAGNQSSCEDLGGYLKEYGYKVGFIHGGLSMGHRNRVLREFREGALRILVTTDLLARGLDIPHVDHIINFDMPYEVDDFLHRIGRTARAGRPGTAITFVTTADVRVFKKLKQYTLGAQEIKLDPKFSFSAQKKFDQSKKAAKQNALEVKQRKDKYSSLNTKTRRTK